MNAKTSSVNSYINKNAESFYRLFRFFIFFFFFWNFLGTKKKVQTNKCDWLHMAGTQTASRWLVSDQIKNGCSFIQLLTYFNDASPYKNSRNLGGMFHNGLAWQSHLDLLRAQTLQRICSFCQSNRLQICAETLTKIFVILL